MIGSRATWGGQLAAFGLLGLALAVDADTLGGNAAVQLMLGFEQFTASLGITLDKFLGGLGQSLALLNDRLARLGPAFVLPGLQLRNSAGEVSQAVVIG
jgi:hypothetical protein